MRLQAPNLAVALPKLVRTPRARLLDRTLQPLRLFSQRSSGDLGGANVRLQRMLLALREGELAVEVCGSRSETVLPWITVCRC